MPDEKTLKEEIVKLEARLKETPKSEDFYRLANAYTRSGRFVDAIKVSKRGLRHHPKLVPGYVALGRSLFGAGKLAKAAKVLRKSLELDDPGSEPYRLLGEILLRLAAPSEAVVILEQAVERDITDKPVQALLERARRILDQEQTQVVEKESELPRGIGNVAIAGTIGVTGEVEMPLVESDAEKTPRLDDRRQAPGERQLSTLPMGILEGSVESTRKVRDPAVSFRKADWNDIDDGWEQELDARSARSFPDVGSDVNGPFDRRPRVEVKLPPLTDPLAEGMPPLPADLDDSGVASLPAPSTSGADTDIRGADPGEGIPEEDLTRPLPTIPMEVFGAAGGILPEVAQKEMQRRARAGQSEAVTTVAKPDDGALESEAVTSPVLEPAKAAGAGPAPPDSPDAAAGALTVPLPPISDQAPSDQAPSDQALTIERPIFDEISAEPSSPFERFDPALAETLPGSTTLEEVSAADEAREQVDASPEGGVDLADLMAFSEAPDVEPPLSQELLEMGAPPEDLPVTDQIYDGIEPYAGKTPRRRWPWIMAVFIIFATAGGGGVYYWKHIRPSAGNAAAVQSGESALLTGTLDAYQTALREVKTVMAQGGDSPELQAQLELVSALAWLHYHAGKQPSVTASHSPWGHVAARAAVKLASHQPEAARPLLEAPPTRQQDIALRNYLLARAAWLGGKREQAERLAQLALEQQPRLSAAHVLIGHLGREVGYLEQAETAYRKAIEVSPKHALAGLCLATVLLERGSTVAEVEKELSHEHTNPLLRAWQGLVLGEQAVRKGELKQGARLLQNALAVAPPRAALLYHGIRVLIQSGRIDAALLAWERLQGIRASRDLAMVLLEAELALAQGLDQRVLLKLKEVDQLPERGRLMRASALAEVGRLQEAAKELEKDTSDHARAFRAYAAVTSSAEAKLDPLRKLAKQSPQAQLLLARALHARGDLDGAMAETKGLTQRPHYRNRAAVLQARIFLSQNKAGAARAALVDVVERSPRFLPARQCLGEAYLELGRYQDAVQRLIGARKAGRSTRDLVVALAMGQTLVGRPREASATLEQARKLGATTEQIKRVTGLINLAEGNGREAVAQLKGAVGNSVVAQVALGRAQLLNGQAPAARASLNRAMAADPSHPLPHIWLGHVHLQAMNPNALFHFKAAIRAANKRQYFPRVMIAEAHVGIARFQLRKRRTKLALVSLNEAVRIDKYNAEAYRFLGQALIGLKRFRAARSALARCHEMDANDATALFLLGTAAKSTPKQARLALRRFLKLEPKGKRARLAQRQLRRLR